MNPLLHWLTSPGWTHVVAALLHSLWQGAILAVVLALGLRRLANPVARYRCALGVLGLLLLANLVTWAVLTSPPPAVSVPPPQAPALAPPPIPLHPDAADKIIVLLQPLQPQTGTNWTAWLAMAWMLGALLMLCRASIKISGAEKLRRSCRPLADDHVAALVAEACRAVQLTRKIRVAVTDQLTSPAVVGVLVPTLILPLSLFTTLTPTQIQFVLLHELAHIRRGDYLANLFQLLAEAFWFFNPAVWWISHQIRREREACCDALAIELSDAPADYARTLVHVAENILQPAPAAATAFDDTGREPSSLADRVQRLLIPGYRPALRLTWRAMLTSLLVGTTLLVLSALGTRNTVGAILASTQSATNNPATSLNEELTADAKAPVKNDIHPDISAWTGLQSDEPLKRQTFFVAGNVKTNSTTQTSATNAAKMEPRQTNVIARGEFVVITFTGLSQPMMPYEEQVKPDGSILLPNVGIIQAAGKSIDQLQQEIHDAYVPRYYKRLSISVKVGANAAATNRVSAATKTLHPLNEIRLEQVYFEREPLSQVLHVLQEKARQSASGNHEIEFALDPGSYGFDPATGLMIPSASNDLASIRVTIPRRTTGPLEGILREIVSYADQPIKYTFTNNMVIFSRRAATESEPLSTRQFDLSWELVREKILTNLPPAELERALASTNYTVASESFRNWIQQLDVNLDPQSGKSVFYSDRKGILLVRATLKELDTIEVALRKLLPPTPLFPHRTFQVEPRVMAEAIVAVVAPQFKTNLAAGMLPFFKTLGVDLSPPKIVLYDDRTGKLLVSAPDEDLELIGQVLHAIGLNKLLVNLKVRWVEMPKPVASELLLPFSTNYFASPDLFTIRTSILPEEKVAQALSRLKIRDEIKLLSEGQVTTLSGRMAQMQTTEKNTVFTGVNPQTFMLPGVIPGVTTTNEDGTVLLDALRISCGPQIDLLPWVNSNRTAISLQVVPLFTEFLGYDNPPDAPEVTVNGKERRVDWPLPRFRTQQTTNFTTLEDGQTLVLGNLTVTEITTKPDGQTETKDITRTQTNNLYIFITATLVDSAGQPLNPPRQPREDLGIPSRLPIR